MNYSYHADIVEITTDTPRGALAACINTPRLLRKDPSIGYDLWSCRRIFSARRTRALIEELAIPTALSWTGRLVVFEGVDEIEDATAGWRCRQLAQNVQTRQYERGSFSGFRDWETLYLHADIDSIVQTRAAVGNALAELLAGCGEETLLLISDSNFLAVPADVVAFMDQIPATVRVVVLTRRARFWVTQLGLPKLREAFDGRIYCDESDGETREIVLDELRWTGASPNVEALRQIHRPSWLFSAFAGRPAWQMLRLESFRQNSQLRKRAPSHLCA